ncbi:uncharacterized protein LOC102966445 [Panthera tigris]|uniref:uncharacterized protein LOC102966445 n=1 Tax=Panthera tigris TaxID=9694 RepID=UPI001C6FB3AF|nr:uncharacterized protein LOC102966445 [Panthera tigris]
MYILALHDELIHLAAGRMMPGIAEKLTHSHQLEFWEYQKVNEVVIKSEKEKLEASRSITAAAAQVLLCSTGSSAHSGVHKIQRKTKLSLPGVYNFALFLVLGEEPLTSLRGVTKRAPGEEERQDFPRGRHSDFLSHQKPAAKHSRLGFKSARQDHIMTFMRPRDFSLDGPLSPLKKGRKITIALIKEAFLLLGQNSFSKELDLTIGPPGYGQGEEEPPVLWLSRKISQRGCHRNCTRGAAIHMIECTIQRREEGTDLESTLTISFREQIFHESPHGNCPQ